MFIYSLFEWEIIVFFWLYSLCDLWCDKFLDFDRRVKFWFVLDSKSVDFTGVLLDWWAVNRLILMCYFIIIYGIFGRVRLKPYFIRAERYFEDIFDDFWWCWKWWKRWFFKVLPNSVSNSKWWSRRGNIRYAVPGFRLPILKCKPRPHHGIKSYYNSAVLWYLLSDQL